MTLQAPFPWFGGKSRVAPVVWQAFGPINNFVEPFFGSGAVLLARPTPIDGPETINDLDGFVANFWRSIIHDPEQTAHYADWPVNECDLHARHMWLIDRRADLTTLLQADPAYCDPQIAGYWVWGLCSWIGSGWCIGQGPWQAIDGRLVDTRQLPHLGNAGRGIHRQLPHLGDAGRGIHRQLPHLGDAGRGIHRKLPHLGDAGRGIHRKLPHLGDAGRGIHRKLPHLGSAGMGIHRKLPHLGNAGRGIADTFNALANRLRAVRVCCGDWTRVTGPSVTIKHAGITGVLLDPPYADTATRSGDLYACDSLTIAHAVREWALANGDHPRLRIALCGYEGEHDMPATWTCQAWKTVGGYGSQGTGQGRENQGRERIWFSPHCLSLAHRPAQQQELDFSPSDE